MVEKVLPELLVEYAMGTDDAKRVDHSIVGFTENSSKSARNPMLSWVDSSVKQSARFWIYYSGSLFRLSLF